MSECGTNWDAAWIALMGMVMVGSIAFWWGYTLDGDGRPQDRDPAGDQSGHHTAKCDVCGADLADGQFIYMQDSRSDAIKVSLDDGWLLTDGHYTCFECRPDEDDDE